MIAGMSKDNERAGIEQRRSDPNTTQMPIEIITADVGSGTADALPAFGLPSIVSPKFAFQIS